MRPIKTVRTTPEHRIEVELKGVQYALEIYKNKFNIYPKTLEEMVKEKIISADLIIDYLSYRPFIYRPIYKNKGIIYYKLWSAGQDGISGTKDDVAAPLSKEEIARIFNLRKHKHLHNRRENNQ